MRPVVYCLVPRDLAAKLHEPLRRHFSDDPGVEVVVERRTRQRRRADDRRAAEAAARRERRAIHNPEGRRVGERRAARVAAAPPGRPPPAQRHADRLLFVKRLEPGTEQAEDLDSARVVTRFQAGDREAFTTLYMRYFDRIYTYMRIALKDVQDAEDATQHVLMKVLEALPRYERRGRPFRAWLFTIVRRHAIEELERRGRLEVVDPAELRERQERSGADDAGPEVPGWLSDRELMLFMERLPLPQRQVLVLRYLLGLGLPEIATVLDRTPSDVRVLQSRALRFLRERLAAIGRTPTSHRRRTGMKRRVGQATVLRERRFALASPWTGTPLRGGPGSR